VVRVRNLNFQQRALRRGEHNSGDLLSGGQGDGRLSRRPDAGVHVGRAGRRRLGGRHLRAEDVAASGQAGEGERPIGAGKGAPWRRGVPACGCEGKGHGGAQGAALLGEHAAGDGGGGGGLGHRHLCTNEQRSYYTVFNPNERGHFSASPLLRLANRRPPTDLSTPIGSLCKGQAGIPGNISAGACLLAVLLQDRSCMTESPVRVAPTP
jgi:hypothetical protein